MDQPATQTTPMATEAQGSEKMEQEVESVNQGTNGNNVETTSPGLTEDQDIPSMDGATSANASLVLTSETNMADTTSNSKTSKPLVDNEQKADTHQSESNETKEASDVTDIKVELADSVLDQPNQVQLPPVSMETEGATAAPESTSAEKSQSENGQNTYYIKWIYFGNNQVPIITQNENGPCPLLAIVNVLLLKGKLTLASMVQMISSEQLMTYLGDYIIESKPKNLTETIQANYEQNMQDGINIMCKLQTGLDVNVKFTGVDDFEYTPECIIFDLLEIPLYHGWLIDPQDSQCIKAIGKLSYNQVVEKIISQKSSDNEETAREALVAEQFLDRTASQLTYHGLCELGHKVKDGELCVFFRNNHFTTLYKHNKELFLLVTDQGFLTETNVVWETLSNVDGDCHFVDGNFRTYTKPEPSTHVIPPPTNVSIGSEEQIDHDYLVALSLQQEGQATNVDSESTAWNSYEKDSASIAKSDHAYAVRLQEEEDRRAAAAAENSQQRAAAPSNHSNPSHSPSSSIPRRSPRDRPKDKDSCAIL